jgi:hypothetical protein
MENKQTAVEFLVSQLKAKKWEDWNDLIQQALELEKEQNQNEFERGFTKCADTLQNILNKGLK